MLAGPEQPGRGLLLGDGPLHDLIDSVPSLLIQADSSRVDLL